MADIKEIPLAPEDPEAEGIIVPATPIDNKEADK